ncbi:uncharacterized protein LOC110842790 [Folsomia candida]|uniref:Interferon-induced, double-stranded RNA-activated protein kinase n=1 Tax=Folsomia candida TaxID=158441 RepID=A0A226ESU6_FOLCA|nr:uncharacterized protein LOC110842790 [Folsomia candida]OXA60320.1 Interferon-induced, double-stranded RNA-activated protein kinase [Folsomia candida]
MESTEDKHHPHAWLAQQKFQKLLGVGAFGMIFETSDATTLSAVKVNFLRMDNGTHGQNLAAPFHLLKRIRHKNLTKIYNVSFKDWKIDELEILIARCENYMTFHRETLQMFYNNGRVPPSMVVQIELCGRDLFSWLKIGKKLGAHLFEIQYQVICGILDGLRHLHQNNVVHRFITPEAVMFSHTLTTEYILPVKISSFQFCLLINSTERNDQDGCKVISDPTHYFSNRYQAPEARSSSSTATCSKTFDIFSMGLLCLAVLLPPGERISSELYYKLVHENDTSIIPDHPEIKNAKELIIQMTKRRPADRLQNLDSVYFRRDPINTPSNTLTMAPQDPDFMDETQFKNFLGSGSFGFVLGTRDNKAIKFIFLSESDGPERNIERTQITREYKTMILAKDHPNIVQILKCAEKLFTSESLHEILKAVALPREVNDSVNLLAMRAQKQKIIVPCFCIQMAICGQSLREWLSEMYDKPLTPSMQDFQIQIVSNLLAGFKYLHSNEIIHRDFKPENVLFSYSSGEERASYTLPVKIGDFGLARFLPEYEEILTPRVGTNSYRAPEAETSFYGVQADIFSLGLVFWEVLQLLDSRVRRSMFYKLVHDHENHPLLVKDHPNLVNAKELVVNMTKRLYRERIQTMEDVVLQLC